MSKENKSKRFISIRLRLFLQVGAIVLIAVTLILALNKWYLSSIYILNQKRTMQDLAEEIDTYDVSSADYSSKIALLEKDNGVTIDVYMSDGTPLYYGAVPTGITGGKIVIKDRHDNPDGSFFEIQENAMSDTQFIVYGKSLKFGGDLEMYSKKTTIDSYADTAINVMLITSILALCATLVAIYFYSKKFTKPLSAKEEKKALEQMASGDTEAKNRLIEHNLRLVAHIIKKYYSNYSDQEDLISIGTIGLIKGINSFDYTKGTRLATYASRCIENEILMHFRSQKKSAQDISMSEPIDTDSEGNPLTLSDIVYTDDTIADDLDKKIKIEKLREYIDEMEDSRDREIILKRYGLFMSKPMTQREIAEEMGISRSYVSRIEKRALKKLREKFTE